VDQVALDELATIWMQADSTLRTAITAAAHTVEQQLTADPYQASESREGEERVTFVAPLGFEIEIDLQKRIVWVGHVWLVRRCGK
jgi:hypothetical protein